MNENKQDVEFIQEQYSQYYEMKRMHLNFSWQIPALAIIAIVAFIGFAQDKLTNLVDAHLVSAISFLLIGSFVRVLFIHHRLNLLFVNYYERAVAEIEKIMDWKWKSITFKFHLV